MSRPRLRVLAAVGASVIALQLGASIVKREGLLSLVAPSMLAILLLLALVRFVTSTDTGPMAFGRILAWTLPAFAAHLAFGLLVTNVGELARYLGGDHGTYHALAKAIANHWTEHSAMPHLPAGKEGFYYILAGLYWVFGPYTSSGLVLNAALAAALVPIVSDTARRVYGDDAVRHVAPLVVLIPGMFLWTSQLLKEAPIIFLIAVAANVGARLAQQVTLGRLCVFGLAAGVMLTVRGYIGLAVTASILLGLVVGRGGVAGIVPAVAATAVLAILVLSLGLGREGYETTVSTNLERVNLVRGAQAQTGESGFAQDADISTPQRALTFLPVGVVQFVLGPFPWQIGSLRQLPALPDVIVWWALIPSLVRGVRIGPSRSRRRALLLLLPAAAATLPLALLIGNFGTVARERTQVVILLIPVIAAGMAVRAAQRREAAGEPNADLEPTRAVGSR